MALTPNSNRTKTVPLWMSSTVPAYFPCTRQFFRFSLLVLPSTLFTSAWMESVSGESPSTFRIRTKMCSPTWNRSLASPSQSKDRSLARMEVSTPKISARTTFSATAMTLACTIRSSWILVCPEES